MSNGYKIVICGVRPGNSEEEVAKCLASLLKQSPEALLPALHSRQAMSLSVKAGASQLQVAKGLKEKMEKIGCACSLNSLDPLPPKAPVCDEYFGNLRLRRFTGREVGLALDAPGYWRDASEDSLLRIQDTGAECWFTASRTPSPGVDLMVWAEIRFGVIPDKMPYFKPYREPYSLETNAGTAVVAEFRGIPPGDTSPQHHLVMCLRPESGAISLNITASVAGFEQNQALYQWLLRTQLRLLPDDASNAVPDSQLYETPLIEELLHLDNPPAAFWENDFFMAAGKRRMAVLHGEISFLYRTKYYATSLTNKSSRPIRVLKFGGFVKFSSGFELHNYSGDWFTAEDFVDWYGVSSGGWIQPGETVCDDCNYGGDAEGFWAYWCCNDLDERFMATADYPRSLTGGLVYSKDEREPGMPVDPYAPCPDGMLKRLQSFTANCLKLARDHAGREIAFDEDGVRWLDEVIEQQRERGDPANWSGLIDVFGAFLGECIIRKCGGNWARYDEVLCVRAGAITVFPFSKVVKQFENGAAEGDSVLGMYRSTFAFQQKPLSLRQQRFAALFKARRDLCYFVARKGNGSEEWASVTRVEDGWVTIEPEWLADSENPPTYSVTLDQIERFHITDARGNVIDLDQVDIPPATPEPARAAATEKPRTHVGSPADQMMGDVLQQLRLVYAQSSRALKGYALESVKAACPQWIRPQDALFGFFDKQEVLLKEGEIRWAALVQANNLLFSPGEADCPAQLLWSDDPYFDARPQELSGIARRVYKLKNTAPTNAEERKIAEQITDEVTRSFGWQLPDSLTDRRIYSTTFMVFRKHIPNGILGAHSFPILTHPSTPHVMITPFEFWPIDLIRLWKDGGL